jgi:glycine dehydrogenase subunit 2
VPECLLIEPTETEAKEELDGFVEAMVAIQREAEQDPAKVKGAPYTLPSAGWTTSRAASNSI